MIRQTRNFKVKETKKPKITKRSNMFEGEIEDLYEETEPKIKTRKPKREKTQTVKPTNQNQPISEKPLECLCNKCGEKVLAELMGSIFSIISNLETPLVRYACRACGHSGKRSVKEKAVSPEKFEFLYL